MSIEKVTVFTDGASRGNPGPAAAAFVVSVDDTVIAESGKVIGTATNNVAEYTALIQALEYVRDMNARHVHVHSDSELMVKQLKGEYRVKHPDLIEYYEQAMELVRHFASVQFTHVRRADNAEADRLGNEALDGRETHAPNWSPTQAPKKSASQSLPIDPVVEYLRTVKLAWSDPNCVEPSVDDVWKHIQKLTGRTKSPRGPRKSSED